MVWSALEATSKGILFLAFSFIFSLFKQHMIKFISGLNALNYNGSTEKRSLPRPRGPFAFFSSYSDRKLLRSSGPLILFIRMNFFFLHIKTIFR